MRAEVEIIDPAYAKQLLEQNPLNRTLSEATVRRYSSDMKNGRWVNNGQGIILTADGTLLDGQHRLAAVVASQVTCAMMVVRGAPKDAFVTLDSGKARNLSDVLSIEGFNNTHVLAAMARLAFGYVSGLKIDTTSTKSTLQEFIHAHPYAIDAASLVGQKSRKFPKASLAAVLFLANEERQFDKEVAQFIDGFFSGEGLFKGDARLTLREWLTNEVRISTARAFSGIARAWNAFSEGRELLVLRPMDNPFQQTLAITGFKREMYPDVPDLAAAAVEARLQAMAKLRASRSNLPAGLVTPPLNP